MKEKNFKSFKEIVNGKRWTVEEFPEVIRDYFGEDNNVSKMINEIVSQFNGTTNKIYFSKRAKNDVVIKFLDGSNAATIWFNISSFSLRIIGDAIFDKRKPVPDIASFEEFEVAKRIAIKVKCE